MAEKQRKRPKKAPPRKPELPPKRAVAPPWPFLEEKESKPEPPEPKPDPDPDMDQKEEQEQKQEQKLPNSDQPTATKILPDLGRATATERHLRRQMELELKIANRIAELNMILQRLCGQAIQEPNKPEDISKENTLDKHDTANQYLAELEDTLAGQVALFAEMI